MIYFKNHCKSTIKVMGPCLLSVLLLSGCAGVAKIPEKPVVVSTNIDMLLGKHTTCASTKNGQCVDPQTGSYMQVMQACSATAQGKRRPSRMDCLEQRNQVLYELLLVSDYYYQNYEANIVAGRASLTFYSDSASGMLAAAGAAISAMPTSQILAGLSAVVTSTKVSADKSFYADQTTAALILQMRADRAKARTRIVAGMSNVYAAYPLELAIYDVNDYYRSGTLAYALVAIQSATGKSAGDAREDEEKSRVKMTESISRLFAKQK